MDNKETERLVCSYCGAELDTEDYYEMQGELLCPDCYHNETIACEHCGERIWLDDNAGSDNMPLCQRCYDDYYTTCECCGRIIHRDYANYDDDDDYYEYFQRMKSYVILRNKTFEIFSADFTFGPSQDKESFTKDEYIEINKFIRENYSLIDFHNGITTWDTIKVLYDKLSANTSEDKPTTKSRGPKVRVSKNDKINLLKKRMMCLNSWLFPNIQT